LSCSGQILKEERRRTTHLHARDKVSMGEHGQDLGDQLAGQELENGILCGDVHIVSIRCLAWRISAVVDDETGGNAHWQRDIGYYPLRNHRAQHHHFGRPVVSLRRCASQCDMSSSLQAEKHCLHFPESLPPHPSLSHQVAVQMPGRSISLATQIAFQPS
jgi:hypothetical protein